MPPPPNTTTIHGATKTTARLHLRRLEWEDLPDIHEFRSDWECAKWATSPPSKSLEETQQWFTNKVSVNPRRLANFAVELLDPERDRRGERRKVIGAVGAVDVAEIGYGFTRAYHGKGYATEAVRGFLELFWENVPPAPTVNGSEAVNVSVSAPTTTAETQANPGEDTRDVLLGSGGVGPEEVKFKAEQEAQLSDGWNYIQAIVDPGNTASVKLAKNCGFILWMSMKDDYESVNLGLRSTAIFRLPRPGTELGPSPGPFEVDVDAMLASK